MQFAYDGPVQKPQEIDDIPARSELTDTSRRMLSGAMLLFALVGLVASVVLSIDALVLAGNPDAELACSINSVFDCATVGASEQSKIFGIPNAFLGMLLQGALVAIAVALLAGAKMPRWYMAALNGLLIVSALYGHWLLYQSTFVIRALCLWCLTLLVCTVLTLYVVTKWNILDGNLFLKGDADARARSFVRAGWLEIALIAWFALTVVGEVAAWLL